MSAPVTTPVPRPAGLRAELLLLGAVTIAGALAGVLVQAALEVAAARRSTRAQLRAAAEQLDQLDVDLQVARAEVDFGRKQTAHLGQLLDAARAELRTFRVAGAVPNAEQLDAAGDVDAGEPEAAAE